MDFSHYLQALFNPKTIAVVGASEREGSLGTMLWNNIQRAKPKAKLFAVNPKYKKIQEARSYSSLSAVRSDLDLVFIVSPPDSYVKTIDQAIQKKCKFILLSGGFPKTELTKEIRAKVLEAQRSGIKVVGPQSLGVINPHASLNASFFPKIPKKGSVGLVSQSPGISCCIMEFIETTSNGFSFVVDPGLEWALSAADYVEMLAYDRQTKCIALYLESFQAPRKLLSAIRTASSTKPVIVLKGGQTPGSADIVINNSGAREDENGVMEEALKRSGALLVRSIRDLNCAIQVFSAGKELSENTLFGIVNSKGLDSLLADHAYRNHLVPAAPDSSTAQILKDKFHITFPYANPINAGLDATIDEIAGLVEFILSLPNCGGLIIGMVQPPQLNPEQLADRLIPILKKTTKPVITAWIGTEENYPATQKLRSAGIPTVTDMRAACRAVSLLEQFSATKRDYRFAAYRAEPIRSDRFEGARKIIRSALAAEQHLLYEEDTKKLLASIGFEVTAGISAGSLGEALEASKALGFPLAMKVRMDGLLSKSKVGGVLLGIRNEKELKTSWKSLQQRVENSFNVQTAFGVFLQRTLNGDNRRELKMGLRLTRHFGPIIYLGIGGLYGSLCSQEVFDFAPLTVSKAERMIQTEPFKTLLGNYHGLGECRKEAIITALLRLSELAVEVPAIRSLEIDPLLCGKNEAVVLDAHCVIGAGPLASDDTASHLILPYSRIFEKEVQAKFGPAKIKTATPEDKPEFLAYLERLSDTSRRLRFHSTASSLELVALSSVAYDPDRTFSLLVREEKEGKEEIIAEARFSLLPNGEDAEFGISVRDDRQGCGLAGLLMSELENEARKRGINHLIGYVLKDNIYMARMMEKRHYQQQPDEDDPHVDLFILNCRG